MRRFFAGWRRSTRARIAYEVKHKDTKAQSHKERPHKLIFDAAFLCGFVPLCLCVLPRLLEISALHESHRRQIQMAAEGVENLLSRQRLNLSLQVCIPRHGTTVMRMRADSADEFPILRAADLLRLQPTGLRGRNLGVGETLLEDFRHLITESRLDLGCIFRRRDRRCQE